MTIAFKLSTVDIGDGVAVEVIDGIGVSVGIGVDDPNFCARAGLIMVADISLVEIELLIPWAGGPTEMQEISSNADTLTKNTRTLFDLNCFFIIFPK